MAEPDHQDNIAHEENAPLAPEAGIPNREKSANAREDALHLRENVADLREETAHIREATVTSREEAAYQREKDIGLNKADADAKESLQTASDDQIDLLREANAHLVISSIEAHKQTEQIRTVKDKLGYLAHHDTLTHLPNRMLLEDRLNQAIELARRHHRQLAVMFMDLDRFKTINDSLGHAVGDQLLQSVAQRLMNCVRHSDTVSRQGGDEFVLLLDDIESSEDARLSAQKILTTLEQIHCIDGHDLQINMSIGISTYPKDGGDAETLLKNADTAMYYAKESGRKNYKFFEQGMNAEAVHRQFIEAELHGALERQEFVLHYQPKINLQSGEIIAVEALIRWLHPKQGLLSPEHFIFIAEDCGLILPMGRWVLREACRQALIWRQAGFKPIRMAVNLSALEFHDINFIQNLRETLQETGFEPQQLELELTENVIMRDIDATDAVLRALTDLGVQIAIDDFGTGYSNLGYLRQPSIGALKIDQSFVSQMSHNPGDALIVKAVIGIGKNLNKRVIAEGVETAAQYASLKEQHCDEGQGYYFARPMDEQALATLLQKGLQLPHAN